MNDECHCDLRHVTSYWLHRQWHAANPGVRPTPWEAPRPPMHRDPLHFDQRPTGLVARLFIVLERHDRTFVAYVRQEPPMFEDEHIDPAEARAALQQALARMVSV